MTALPRPNSQIPTHRHGDKKKLYKTLADRYFLPPRDSTGVTLRYLERVEHGTVFRVSLLTLKRFLAELTTSQLKTSVYTCKFEAYDKLNRLLAERGQPTLGFEDGLVPDGKWLFRVARYVDRADVCGLFEVALGPVGEGDTNTEKLYRAQNRAKKELLEDTGLGKRREISPYMDSLRLAHKRLISYQAEQANLLTYSQKLEKRVAEARQSVERVLGTASLAVYQVGKGVSPEEALETRDPQKASVLEVLRFVMATDCVLDRSDSVATVALRYCE